MADYQCNYRTSYFRVTDEKRYNELCARIVGDVEFFTDETGLYHGFGGYGSSPLYEKLPSECPRVKEAIEQGETLFGEDGPVDPIDDDKAILIADLKEADWYVKYGFVTLSTREGEVYYYYDESMPLEDSEFVAEIQKIIHPDDAFVLIQVGHENLRLCDGYVTIVTAQERRFITLSEVIHENLAEMLGEQRASDVRTSD